MPRSVHRSVVARTDVERLLWTPLLRSILHFWINPNEEKTTIHCILLYQATNSLSTLGEEKKRHLPIITCYVHNILGFDANKTNKPNRFFIWLNRVELSIDFDIKPRSSHFQCEEETRERDRVRSICTVKLEILPGSRKDLVRTYCTDWSMTTQPRLFLSSSNSLEKQERWRRRKKAISRKINKSPFWDKLQINSPHLAHPKKE